MKEQDKEDDDDDEQETALDEKEKKKKTRHINPNETLKQNLQELHHIDQAS
eukprot:CAMPEP_0170551324 /NCGR_PEP_ID=MMETSP0211-20121228/9344_1 /TAXON_ID=311385 /ORGANISM="Pseudokeronopsis sp., Strain OXSARD2" /LENGTH=50 /DNA_ID=CAMNT_0010858425 /DNA_START=369 /DNA_END=521 /DNA_ORIENTATION=+